MINIIIIVMNVKTRNININTLSLIQTSSSNGIQNHTFMVRHNGRTIVMAMCMLSISLSLLVWIGLMVLM